MTKLILIYDKGATPERILRYVREGNPRRFKGRDDVLIDPDIRGLFKRVPLRYWKHVAGAVVEMTPGEKAAHDAAEAQKQTTNLREAALAVLDELGKVGRLIRALALVTMDENNRNRLWLQDFKDHVAAATSLADLKSRVASLPNMPQRTALQLLQAIRDKINA